jgi:anaerobic magnesium-protoporphyrin IX monomethyl ester cyclase
MKIQFFVPPVHHYAGIRYRMLPTIGLPTLAAWFNQRGHTAEVTDLEALSVSPAQFLTKFAAQKDKWPDVIGVTALTISKRGAREIIAAIRGAGFTGKVVVGGVHVSTNPQDGLDWGADLVITGECEGNVIDLIEHETGIHAGQPADIADIPAPDWSHFRPMITTYESNLRMLLPNPGISMWGRGCPWKCIFCSNVVFGGRKTRYRPAENVAADMTALKELGVQNVYVYDDELVGMPQPGGWMNDIADRIASLGLKWITQGRCSKKHITLELLQACKRAGCHTIFWGVESFSNRILKAVKKGITTEDIWHTLRTAKEAGIKNAVFTMIGNYQETDDDLQMTLQGLKDAYQEGLVQMRQTTICTPMAGTRLAEYAQAEGWYSDAPDFGPQMLQHAPTPWLPVDRMMYWQRQFDAACPVGLA